MESGRRLEEIHDQTSWETLQQFDSRLEAAAQVIVKDEWLEDLVNAGGSPAEVLRLPSSEPTRQVCCLLASSLSMDPAALESNMVLRATCSSRTSWLEKYGFSKANTSVKPSSET